jgi:hypothetical protein
MSAKEEGIHQVLRKPSSRPREPEQGAHRRAQVTKGALLPAESGVKKCGRCLPSFPHKECCRCLKPTSAVLLVSC